jgi:DNA-binding Xre family transcriptional regulator
VGKMPTIMNLDYAIAVYGVKTGKIISIEKLSEVTGISKSALYRLRSGNSSPSLEQINALTKALDCKVNDLFFTIPTHKKRDEQSEADVSASEGTDGV